MKTLSLILALSLPAQAGAAGLNCQGNGGQDRYKNFRNAQTQRMQSDAAGLKSAGLSDANRKSMLNSLLKDYTRLCDLKKDLDTAKMKLSAVASDNTLGQGKGVLDKTAKPLQEASSAGKKLDDALKRAYDQQSANYQKSLTSEWNGVKEKIKLPPVLDSFRRAWGVSSATEKLTDGGRRAGQFSSLVDDIKKELDASQTRQGELEKIAKSAEENKDKAKSLNDEAAKKAADMPATADLNGDGKVDDADKGVFPPAPGSGDVAANIGAGDGAGDGATTTPPPADTSGGDGEVAPPPADNTTTTGGGIGQWASDHKGMLLLGAGAAAVGGILLYQHNKDKHDDGGSGDDSDSTGTATETNTSTSTDTSTVATADVTSANGYALRVSGFPTTSVVKNQVIDPIVVKVYGPNGSQAAVDGLEVTVSCTGSCGMTGVLKKTAYDGRAEFGGIYFVKPTSGVQLRVSAPGLDSVASPGSFAITD